MKLETVVSSKREQIVISDSGPMILVGERINPTGKERIASALRRRDFSVLCKEAIDQVEAGADIVDVNVGVAGLDEVSLFPDVIKAITESVEVPLCFDSNNPAALEAGLRVYEGRPLLNSVTGEDRSLDAVLPLVKEYDAAVICLPIDENGIPNSAQERFSIASKIVERAEGMGIPRENILIDCLAQSVGADPMAGLITLNTIKEVREKLSLNTTIGASNGSFGLPDREVTNNAFIAIAIAYGVTCAIADVRKVRPTVLAVDLLLGRDELARRYLKGFRERQRYL